MNVVRFSYLVAGVYCVADTADKTQKESLVSTCTYCVQHGGRADLSDIAPRRCCCLTQYEEKISLYLEGYRQDARLEKRSAVVAVR